MSPRSLALPSLLACAAGLLFWARPPFDPDLGTHLVAGAWMTDQAYALLNHGSFSLAAIVPHQDFINTFNSSWHDYYWLAQLLLYWIYRLGGYDLLSGMLALLMAYTSVVLVTIVARSLGRAASPQNVSIVLLPAVLLLFDIASVRPQMIALCGLALATRLMLNKPSRRSLLQLFAIAAVLANVHIFWVWIPTLWFLHACLPSFARRNVASVILSWGGLLLLGSAAFISPYGPLGGWEPGDLFLNYRPLLDLISVPAAGRSLIVELRSPFSGWGTVPLILLAAVVVFARAINRRMIACGLPDAVLAVTTLLLAFTAVRFTGLLAILGLPFFARLARRLFLRTRASWWRSAHASILVPVLVFALLTRQASNAFLSLEPREAIIARALPIEECAHAAKLPLVPAASRPDIRALTYFDYGGWCRWAAYQAAPERDFRVTTDGRTDKATLGRNIQSFDLWNLKEGWMDTLQAWAPDVIVAQRGLPFSHVLFMLPQQWEPISTNERFALFAPLRAKNGEKSAGSTNNYSRE